MEGMYVCMYTCQFGYSDDGFVVQGCGPTVVRAMVVNAAQLATYSQAKQNLLTTGKQCCKAYALNEAQFYNVCKELFYYNVVFYFTDYFVDDIRCHFAASMISGLVTTVVSMPVDIAKTRWVITVISTAN